MIDQIRRVAQRATLFSQIRQDIFREWLSEQLGEYNYFIDLDQRACSFSSKEHSPTDTTEILSEPFLLATIAADPPTLRWGFAEEHEKDTGPNPAARGVREFGMQQNLRAFSTPEFPHEAESTESAEATPETKLETLGQDLGQAAVEIFGPGILYSTVPIGTDGSCAVYLHSNFSQNPPGPDFAEVATRLPRLLPGCDDIGWSLAGLAHLLGWRFESLPTPDTWLLVSEDAQLLQIGVEYDGQGQLSDIQVKY